MGCDEFMRDNRGITLIELVVSIAIFGIIIATIYSFYVTGVKGFARGTSTATNQVSVRRVSNEVAREIRKASNVEVPDSYTIILRDEVGNMLAEIEYISTDNTIKADYYTEAADGSWVFSHNRKLAERIGFFEATTNSDKTIVTIESIGNSEGYTDKLETVITKRK